MYDQGLQETDDFVNFDDDVGESTDLFTWWQSQHEGVRHACLTLLTVDGVY